MVSIRTFGKFSVQGEGESFAGLHAGKVLELFCYLLLQRERFHSRESLATLLWGDFTTAQSRKYLRQALWQLQAVLVEISHSGLLEVTRDAVCFNLKSGAWLDVAVFEDAYLQAKGVRGVDLNEGQAQRLKEAVSLYHGDLLEGWYQDWCLFERERLQNIYMCLLEKLMRYCGKNGEYEAGLEFGERILRLDRAHESSHQEMMRLHSLAGDRVGAIRQYQRCEAALWEELRVKPSLRTTQLLGQIRAGQGEPGTLPEAADAATEAARTEGVLGGIFARLLRLRLALEDLQTQVQTEIQTVEKALPSYKEPSAIAITPNRSRAS